MTKKNLYFVILISALVVIAAAFLLNIKAITGIVISLKGHINEWPIWASAVVCAFIFSRYKYYWPAITAAAFCTALVYHIYIHSSLAKLGLYTLCIRSLLFIAIVFAIDYLRLIFKR